MNRPHRGFYDTDCVVRRNVVRICRDSGSNFNLCTDDLNKEMAKTHNARPQ